MIKYIYIRGVIFDNYFVNKKILVIGGRSFAGINFIRLLKYSDNTVFSAEFIKYYTTKKSRHIKKSFTICSPKINSDQFIKDINGIVKNHQIDIIVPISEETLYLSKYKNKINCACFVDQFQKINRLHNKYLFSKFCLDNNILIPETKHFNKGKVKINISEKMVLKYDYSRFSNGTRILQNESVDNLESDSILQTFINGMEVCSYAICYKGEVIKNVNYELLYRHLNGPGIYFKMFYSKKIDDLVNKIVKKLNFTGQIAFDMIIKDNLIYMIECNPRATSGVGIMPLDVLKNKNSVRYRTQSIKLMMLIDGVKNKWIFKQNFWMDFFNSRDTTFDAKDLMPYFYQFLSVFCFFKTSYKKSISLSEASTFDIEFSEESNDKNIF